jgi:hypothetical protein
MRKPLEEQEALQKEILKSYNTLELLKTDLIPLHPPLSKGGDLSPPFGKGRLGGIL